MSTDGKVLPKPGIPKTLGILNVIFGVLLVLLGICGLGSLLAAPALFDVMEKTVKEQQSKVEEKGKADIKAIDDRLAEAKTDEEKKAIEAERSAAVAAQPKTVQVDLSAATDVFKDKTIMGVNYAGAITGLILHVVLLISGIGLIRLTPWGRSLGLAWAVLQILQVVLLLGATLVYVLPANKVNTDKQIAKLEAQVKAGGAGPAEANALQMTKTMASMAAPLAVGQSLSGLIYPIILLILLSTKGARAACLPKRIDDIDGFAPL
jgi:hypothetical protein